MFLIYLFFYDKITLFYRRIFFFYINRKFYQEDIIQYPTKVSSMKGLLLIASGLLGLATAAYDPNLVVNGDFSQTDCKQDYCIYTSTNFEGHCLEGWIPDTQMEVGYGSIYSDQLDNCRVAELAPNKNSCIKQYITNIGAGNYQLQFTWGARKGRTFPDCQFIVQWNGQTVGSYTPGDYNLHTQSIDIKVQNSCDYGQLKFCGVGGDDNSYGAFVKDVSLVKKSGKGLTFDFGSPININDIKQQVQVKPIDIDPVYMDPIFLIDSHSHNCFSRNYQLQAGYHQLTFNYHALFSGLVKDSYLVVKLNGKVLGNIYPRDCQSHDYVFEVLTTAGVNTLELCPAGCPGEQFFKVLIKNLALNYKPCLGKKYQNLIKNGDFQTNTCPANNNYCIFNNGSVANWIPNPTIEIGYGSIYSSVIGNTRVIELDPSGNSCITQKLALKAGKHTLKFDWATRNGVAFDSATFDVKINNQIIKSVTPADYLLHKESLDFTLANPPLQSQVTFCGTGKSDSYGSLIDNVELNYLDECKQNTGGYGFPSFPNFPSLPSYMPKW